MKWKKKNREKKNQVSISCVMYVFLSIYNNTILFLKKCKQTYILLPLNRIKNSLTEEGGTDKLPLYNRFNGGYQRRRKKVFDSTLIFTVFLPFPQKKDKLEQS